MTTATLTLTDFLLARIAEDEAVARRCETGPPIVLAMQVGVDHSQGVQSGWVEVDAGRVLAECEARRRIVEAHPLEYGEFDEPGCFTCNETNHIDGGRYASGWPCPTMSALAGVHADHPDYRDEWRI